MKISNGIKEVFNIFQNKESYFDNIDKKQANKTSYYSFNQEYKRY